MDNNIAKVMAWNDSNESEMWKKWSKGEYDDEEEEEESIYVYMYIRYQSFSAQSFLIYFVIVLCHGFILMENLYMRLNFENET